MRAEFLAVGAKELAQALDVGLPHDVGVGRDLEARLGVGEVTRAVEREAEFRGVEDLEDDHVLAAVLEVCV